MDLIIEGNPAELEWLRREIEDELGAEADLEAQTSSTDPDTLNEPLIIALIVALGGPVVVRKVADVLKRRYQHKETIAEIAKELRLGELQIESELRLKQVEADGRRRPLTEEELAALAGNS